jgi:hypothetical protein
LGTALPPAGFRACKVTGENLGLAWLGYWTGNAAKLFLCRIF